jgi:protease PrsW
MSHAETTAGKTSGSRSVLVSPLAVVMAVVSVWALVEVYRADRITILSDGWHIFFGAAAIWIVYGAIAIGLVVLLQRYARRPAWTIALALAWGACIAIYFTAVSNSAFSTIFQNASGSDDSIWTTGPVVEELAKGVGVILLALVPVLRRFGPLDGLFYGVVVGAGFQVFEDFTYSLSVASETANGQWEAIWINVFLRGVFGLFTHAVWTGIFGAAVGWVAVGGSSGRAKRVLVAVAAFVLVVVLHGADDWTSLEQKIALSFVVDGTSLAILVVILLRLQRSERNRLTALAVDNDGWGVLDPSDLAVKEQGRAERKRRRLELRYAYARDQYGPDGPITRRAQTKLARAAAESVPAAAESS